MATNQSFGTMFRAKRNALGLTLREFCRRNGFDSGNISRLERGLVPPPQTQRLLEGYAKALKLKKGTEAWESFFERAATENGRIPADVNGGQGHARWVRALNLEMWAPTSDARVTLPQLVRRLVRATGKDLKLVEFPAGEQVQRPGWDGVVQAGEADEFVPAGNSVWELSTQKTPATKAKGDFDKRAKDPLGLDRKQTTFVVVTPRKFQVKEGWRRAEQALGVWKDVRVYDSASLEEWLEQAPAVDAWLAGILGLKPPGVSVIDDYWSNLQAMTEPSLKPEVFLASRDEQVKELEKWLKGPPGALMIQARSPAEAVDFVAAYSREPSRADVFDSRALIVENREAWRSLSAAQAAGLLLIAHPTLAIEPELVAEAVRQGHRVIVASSQPPREGVVTLELPRAYRYDLEKALEASGLDAQKADRYAREAGGSLTVLKRLIGRLPDTQRPQWSASGEASALAPLLLAGSWGETSEPDRLAIEKLAAQPYHAVSTLVERWLQAADSPLARVGSRVSFVSREDAWFLVGPCVSPDALGRFEKVALEVLAEDDPAYELPLEARWQSVFQEKPPRHSEALRNGVAETLALLGARPERLSCVPDARGRVERLVAKLFESANWIRWASLGRQLALLAEAAPDAFLAAVERDLKRSKPALVNLFAQEGDLIFTSVPHTGLLWALEVLAWNSDFLTRVGLILAALDEKTPRGRSGNTPPHSLLRILMPWLPQTTATLSERIKVLELLVKKQPAAAWRLLTGLLPNQQPFSTSIQRPTWRDWALTWSGRVSNVERWRQVVACANLLVDHLEENIERWKDLIVQLENLPEETRSEFLERLRGFAETTTDEESRRSLADALRKKVSHHRTFPTAKWVFPDKLLEELEEIRIRFEPKDVVRRNLWLFGRLWDALRVLGGKEDRLAELRRGALQEILDQEGWQGILRLVPLAYSPGEVGAALAQLASVEHETKVLPALLVSADEKLAEFARGYSLERFRVEGWDWVDRLSLDDWLAEAVAGVLVTLPFERRTWDFAAKKGEAVATWYWTHCQPFLRGEEVGEAEFAALMFMQHKRATEALQVLGWALHHGSPLESDLLMKALEACLEFVISTGNEGQLQWVRFHVHPLFQELQKRLATNDSQVDFDRLGRLEWQYLGWLDGHPVSPVTLHRLLRDNADLFVDVLGLVFRPKNETKKEAGEISKEEQGRAQQAFQLLMSWQEVPGSRDDGTVDEKTLFGWIEKARSMAEKCGLLEVCDSRIGEVLAHAPEEADGSWPCIPVRDAIEEIDTEDVSQGLCAGIFNKRGMVSKSLREGGAQERVLAEKYRKFADACKVEWPRTAAALRNMADTYEDEARREDSRARLRDA